MAKRPAPPAFKATIRTASLRMDIESPSISAGIRESFIMLAGEPEAREKLLLALQEKHAQMLANAAA